MPRKPRLLGISKRGNRYPRKNLIHGARAVLPRSRTRTRRLSDGHDALLARAPQNVVTVALANKLARIVWAVLAHDRGRRRLRDGMRTDDRQRIPR